MKIVLQRVKEASVSERGLNHQYEIDEDVYDYIARMSSGVPEVFKFEGVAFPISCCFDVHFSIFFFVSGEQEPMPDIVFVGFVLMAQKQVRYRNVLI